MPPTIISPIQAASMVVSDAEMPPRTVYPSDFLAAAPQALVNDAVSVGPFDSPWNLSKKTTDPSLIEQHLSSSEDYSMSVSGPVLVQSTTEDILNPDPIVNASTSCSEDRSLTVLSIGPALAQSTTEEILDSSSESRYLSFPPPALAQRATTEEEAIEEEVVMEDFDIEYASSSPGHFLSAPALATFMEKEEYGEDGFIIAEDHPVPQVALPEYDPNDPLWMYIDTWLNQLPNSRIPDPFVHVPAQYHHCLETLLNSILPPSLTSHQVQDGGIDSSSNNGPMPLGAHPNAQGPSAMPSPSTPTPMTVDDDGSLMLSTPPGPLNSMWAIDEDDDLHTPYQQDWMPCNQHVAARVLGQFEVDYDEHYADNVQHLDDFQSEEE
ncbi:hypothetical protein EC957_001220 [Mortierella hygrophila]|uniref:Uncharacterized protein n=1 Tax=Mortierella hygrophila TaxID=979708 RepID=A0A9P6F537_9FUNG|nr:hypothetical protein EC957_001220 [Mortierella hygrophila]